MTCSRRSFLLTVPGAALSSAAFGQPKDPAPDAKGIAVSILAIQPDLHSVELDRFPSLVTSREFHDLTGYPGLHERGSDIIRFSLSLTNLDATSCVIAHDSVEGILMYRTVFSDAGGKQWKVTSLVRGHPDEIVFTIPVLGQCTKRVNWERWMAAIAPIDAHPGEAIPDPTWIEYRIDAQAEALVRPLVGGGLIGPTVRVPVRGCGRCLISRTGEM